jgi:hypothetical protein
MAVAVVARITMTAVSAARDLIPGQTTKHSTANGAACAVGYRASNDTTGDAADNRPAQMIVSAATIGIGRHRCAESDNCHGCRGEDVLEHARSPLDLQ